MLGLKGAAGPMVQAGSSKDIRASSLSSCARSTPGLTQISSSAKVPVDLYKPWLYHSMAFSRLQGRDMPYAWP